MVFCLYIWYFKCVKFLFLLFNYLVFICLNCCVGVDFEVDVDELIDWDFVGLGEDGVDGEFVSDDFKNFVDFD